jgi:hypothetical protein
MCAVRPGAGQLAAKTAFCGFGHAKRANGAEIAVSEAGYLPLIRNGGLAVGFRLRTLQRPSCPKGLSPPPTEDRRWDRCADYRTSPPELARWTGVVLGAEALC